MKRSSTRIAWLSLRAPASLVELRVVKLTTSGSIWQKRGAVSLTLSSLRAETLFTRYIKGGVPKVSAGVIDYKGRLS